MTDHYAAMDVHSATKHCVIVNSRGKLVSETVLETSGELLVAFAKSIPGKAHLTFEEGAQSAWLYDLLQPHVAELIVCDPRKNKQHGNKNDRIDGQRLAELLRNNSLSPVYHRNHGTKALKVYVQGYQNLVQSSVRTMLRIKSMYRSRGVSTRGGSIYNPREKREWIAKLDDPGLCVRVDWLYQELEALLALREKARLKVLTESRKHKACRLLRSAPGIGPIHAAQIVSQVVTPFRFRTKRQFWSYCGLAVVMRSSDDYEIVNGKYRKKKKQVSVRGLNSNYNHLLKYAFKDAAITAKSCSALKEYYQRRIDEGMKPEMARLTVARKMAAICLAMWKKGESYEENKALRRTE
ncbi:transposase [Acidobacteriota bacterium]